MNAGVERVQAGAFAPAISRLGVYLELTKPRLTTLVLFAVGAGFLTGSAGPIDPMVLVMTLLGTFLTAGGGHALNMLLERRADAVMKRTAGRPIPSGRLTPQSVAIAGGVMTAVGLAVLLVFANWLTAAISAFTVATYLLAYTPLKSRTSFNTLVGAVPGAMPVLLGYAAASGQLGAGAWFLFAIVFVWQIPHFLAIAWIYRDQYAKAGYPMLPVLDKTGEITSRQILANSVGLTLLSMVPVVSGMVGISYMIGALALGAMMIWPSIRFVRVRSDRAARQVFHASLAYLPVLMCLYLANLEIARLWI